jgi:glycosyltransferase involved in cell wall biosynthesis
MTAVSIGIPVNEDPARLLSTLASLAKHSSPDTEIILLPDGPDAAMTRALAGLPDYRQSGTSDPRGPPACFNRLARLAKADVVVLLESGALVGPEWLERLLKALAAQPTHGLAGPSTNRAWNEQAVAPAARGTTEDVTARAAELAHRFAHQWRTLAPLHSLADFCYAVRREVYATIGEADEGYGLGPCWEMDYNIRAARAGYVGIWAQSAYVYRSVFTRRRAHNEAKLFEASRRRYQDKFCGLRLRAERADYEPHCRGDSCEHFAPRELIQIRRTAESPVVVRAVEAAPLVSCIMPTRGRIDFVLQSIRYFQRQTISTTELLILDDGPLDLASRMPFDSRIRYLRSAPGQSIGVKRNQGVESARGRFIAHWDDDDWYAPTRLETQIAPLAAGTADISGLISGTFLVLPSWQFWKVTAALHRRLFVGDVHGGTLVYDRRVWDRGTRYPDSSLAEDAAFLREALRRQARLTRLLGDREFIYIRHEGNSWQFRCGSYLDSAGWVPVGEPEQLGEDRDFYRSRSVAAQGTAGSGRPLVSCIMPTANRRRFVAHAVEYFLKQDYPAAELVVVDDGTDAVADLMPADARVRYQHLERPTLLGSKRNLACEMARGDLILHWDDDDWMAPDRIARQAEVFYNSAAEVSGLSELFFYSPVSREAWRYRYRPMGKPWVAGNTMCYRKGIWRKAPFAAVAEGEDTRFVWSLRSSQVSALNDPSFFIGIVHDSNTAPKRRHDPSWTAVDPTPLRALMGSDIAFYDSLETASHSGANLSIAAPSWV